MSEEKTEEQVNPFENHPKVVAIREHRTCEFCRFRAPRHSPIMAPVPPKGRPVMLPNGQVRQEFMPLTICDNPDSDKFLSVNMKSCTCGSFTEMETDTVKVDEIN